MSDQTVTAGSLPAAFSEGWAHWARVAASAAADRLGRDTTIIDVGDVISVTDYFVIVSGNTARQVRAIAEEVEEQLMILDLSLIHI